MRRGILVIGLNGSGKTTLGRALAKRLGFLRMDAEDYYFLDSEVPYTRSRTREEVQRLMLADIEGNVPCEGSVPRGGGAPCEGFVLSSVNANWDEEITSRCALAVLLRAPREVRLRRIERREAEKFGPRVLEGGDMFEQQQAFYAFVAARAPEEVEKSAGALRCPILRLDATRPVEALAEEVARRYFEIVQRQRGESSMATIRYFSEAEAVDAGNGVTRRVLAYTKEMMVVQVAFEAGGIGATHTHPHVQSTYVASGKFIYTVDGVDYTLGAGDSVVVEPNAPHGTKCLEAGILVDVFSPMREDFLR